MNQKLLSKIILAILALIISAYLNFDRLSFFNFLFYSIFIGLIVFLFLYALYTAIHYTILKNIKKAFQAFGVSILFLILSSTALFITSNVVCPAAMKPDHFRTNILTGKCEYGGGANCLIESPWYYQKGCYGEDIVRAAKKSEYDLDSRIMKCEDYCAKNLVGVFCSKNDDPYGFGQTEIDCPILVDCENIRCDL